MSDGTYTMSIPARRGFIVGFRFIVAAIACVFTRDPSITIDMGVTFVDDRAKILSDPAFIEGMERAKREHDAGLFRPFRRAVRRLHEPYYTFLAMIAFLAFGFALGFTLSLAWCLP